jgi:rubredoxin
MRYICTNCGYIYEPSKGDPLSEIPAATEFDQLPDNWCCPLCYLGKDAFDPLD